MVWLSANWAAMRLALARTAVPWSASHAEERWPKAIAWRWEVGTDFLHDRGHTGADLFAGIITGVVLTDHYYGECRCEAGEIAVVEAPRTCSVRSPLMPRFNAWRERSCGPRCLSPVSLVLDNGVTHIDQIDMALLGPRVHGLVAGYPGRLGRVGHRLNCGISRRSRRGPAARGGQSG